MSIKVSNLFYTYAKKTPNEHLALNDVSLEIKQGDFVSIVGHTGSGKSTLVQHLNGLLVADSGLIEIDDFTVYPYKQRRKNKKLHSLRKHVGVVFQFPEYQLFEETIVKDVAFGPKNFKVKEKEATEIAKKALLSVGIPETYFERSPFELSGGERRRVAIAGIFALEPDIVILDEPTAGLDPKGQKEIMNLLVKMNQEGKTIILVTHDMDLVLRYTNHVFVLKDKELVFSGTPIELFSHNREDLSIEIPPLFTFARMLKKKGLDININDIRNVDDLFEQIQKEKKR